MSRCNVYYMPIFANLVELDGPEGIQYKLVDEDTFNYIKKQTEPMEQSIIASRAKAITVADSNGDGFISCIYDSHADLKKACEENDIAINGKLTGYLF